MYVYAMVQKEKVGNQAKVHKRVNRALKVYIYEQTLI